MAPRPEAFAGKVAARGRMHTHERTVDGELAITGDALKIFQLPVDSLTARIGLESGRAQVDQLELKRGEDFLRAQGKIDLAQKKSFTLSAESWCRELGDYALEFPVDRKLSGALSAKLTGAGDENSFSSTVSGQADQFSFSAQTNWRSDAIAVNSLKLKAESKCRGRTQRDNRPDRPQNIFAPIFLQRTNCTAMDHLPTGLRTRF